MADPVTLDVSDRVNGHKSPETANGGESSSQAVIIHPQNRSSSWLRRWRYALAAAGFALFVTPFTTLGSLLQPAEKPIDPTNYALRTERVLKTTPLIDGHNDLPWQLRIELHNRVYDESFNPRQKLLGHTDILRMRQGMVGGQFWSVYVECDRAQKHFEDPSVSFITNLG